MKQRPTTRAQLGPFVVDVRSGELRCNGAGILLPGQVLQVLLILMERGRDLVTRDELKKMLWPNDTVVEFEHGINNTIKKLRRALSDSADEPRYIETIPRRGYRLIVPVEWLGDPESAAAISSDKSFATPADALSPPAEGGEVEEPALRLAKGPAVDDSQALPKAGLKAGRLTGNIVSHYRVLEVIGGGGMGLVYRAEDLKLGRAVALKFLPEEVSDDPKAHQRFDREARAVSALSHPNICPIYEFAEHDGQPFIVMELLQGRTLRDHLADGHFRLSEPEGLEIAIQIALGLEAAHEKGIIHRDIKPANIFITERNVAKILDFGVAKMLSVVETSESPHPGNGSPNGAPESSLQDQVGSPDGAAFQSQTNLTRYGTKLGTAGYMSPEQIRGEPLDERTDIFSFGLVLYEMATGVRAFAGETEAIMHDAIEKQVPKSVRSWAPKVSPGLAGVVEKCLEKRREQRLQTIRQLRIALNELQRTESPASPSMPRDTERKSRHKGWLVALATVAVLFAIAAAVSYRRGRLAAQLTDQDTIVVGDFANLTSDRLFDNSFKDALEVALGQTPFLNPLSAEKVSQILKVMEKPPGEPLTPAIAREVCQRTRSAAYVTGSISDAGNQYRLELNAVDCKTDRTLASASAQAAQQNQIVAKLGDAVYGLREKLGESPASLKKFNKPLAEATTASIEALQAYRAAGTHYGDPESVLDLKRATELDPDFALAYLSLAQSYNQLRLSDRRDQNLAKAYRLREHRLSRPERLAVEFEYYMSVTGEYDKLVAATELAIQEFPRWWKPRNQLGRALSWLGDYERSAGVLRETVRLSPDGLPANSNLSRCYVAMDRLQDARDLLDQAESRIPDKWQLRMIRYVVAFLENDRRAMDDVVRWAKNKPDVADLMLKEQSETAAYYGRVSEAGDFMRQAVEVAVKTGASERAADWKAIEALRLARIGETDRARRLAQEATSPNSSLQAKLMTAMAFAKAGDTINAQQLVQELREKYPLNSLLRDRDLPSIQAEIYLQQGRPELAIAALERAVPYELGWSQQFGADVVYVRGEAYLQAGKGQEAASQFRKMLDHSGLLATSINGPLARLQLARAQAMAGDTEAARKSYQDFLTLWKDADPDIPIYQQAKVEYARLK